VAIYALGEIVGGGLLGANRECEKNENGEDECVLSQTFRKSGEIDGKPKIVVNVQRF